MTRKTLLTIAATVLLSFSGFEYYLQAQSSEFPLGIGAESQYGKVGLHEDDFDRGVCEQDCRDQYGGVFGSPDDPRARLYARCLQECERQFWKKFDRRTKELEREKE
jgi:hypothetical protein